LGDAQRLIDHHRDLESRLANAEARLGDAQRLIDHHRDLESRLANAEARLGDAQRLIDHYISTIQDLEVRLQASGIALSLPSGVELDERPNTLLEDVFEKYGLKMLARSVKVRRVLLEKRKKSP